VIQKMPEIPEGAKTQEMVAFAALIDPYAGSVEADEEFTTTEEQARQYVRSNWAGPAGGNAREVQLEVAQEEFAVRKDARKYARASRQVFRNLMPNSAARGNSAAAGRVPVVLGVTEDDKDVRTNQQATKLDSLGGDVMGEDSKLPSPGNPDAQRLQDEAEERARSENSGDENTESPERRERKRRKAEEEGSGDDAQNTESNK
jgi:hypothetical protein